MHLVTGLQPHGAERMMARLISTIDRDDVTFRVVCLTGDGPVGDDLRSRGVEVTALDIDKVLGVVRGPSGVLAELRRWKPDVLQTWLYDADLIGGVAGRIAKVPVVWNLRQTVPDLAQSKTRTKWVVRTCARVSSKVPRRIVCCAPEVLATHSRVGYDEERMVVIPNGTDTDAFRPDPAARIAVRAELGIGDETPLVGLVARVAPQKDHATFAAAASRVSSLRPDVRFTLLGTGANETNPDLMSILTAAGIRERTLLLGQREDVSRVTAAFDLAVSSSAFGEGYPNAVAEALSTGVPCVATDVGHSAALVGDAGRVVAPRDPAALAHAVLELLELAPAERQEVGARGRKQIESEASLPAVADRYMSLWREVLLCAG
jgi:glycosyltransferase involved in cell wall biosynthesis